MTLPTSPTQRARIRPAFRLSIRGYYRAGQYLPTAAGVITGTMTRTRSLVLAFLLIALSANGLSAQQLATDSLLLSNGERATAPEILITVGASGIGTLAGWHLGRRVLGHGSGDDPGLDAGVAGAIIVGTIGAALATDLLAHQETDDAWSAAAIGIIPGVLSGIAAAALSDGSVSAVVVGYALGQGVFTAAVAPLLN